MKGLSMGIFDSLLIMIIGMGGVFLFLLLLVGVMTWITTLFPHVPEAPKPLPSKPASSNDDALIAVLQAAVVAYEADKSTTTK